MVSFLVDFIDQNFEVDEFEEEEQELLTEIRNSLGSCAASTGASGAHRTRSDGASFGHSVPSCLRMAMMLTAAP